MAIFSKISTCSFKTTAKAGEDRKPLKESELQDFLDTLRCKVLFKADGDEYLEACKIWNACIERRPALIVQCMGQADALACVNFAKKHSIEVCVRGGGHNIAGKCIFDDCLMIDFSEWRTVTVDAERQVASCAPGATIGDLDHESCACGLVMSLGINSTTGVGGLCLGGGLGWTSRSFGLTCDNLVGATVILQDGSIVQCSKDKHEDLFWALRGGMGNYGVVTNFQFALHKLPSGSTEVYAGPIVYPIDQAKTVLTALGKAVKETPNTTCPWGVVRQAPPFPFVPESHHFKPVVIVPVCSVAATEEQAKVEVQPFLELGGVTPLGNGLGKVPLNKWYQAFDPLLTDGARNYWRTVMVPEVTEGFVDVLVKHGNNIQNFGTELFLPFMGGKIDSVKPEETAFVHRGHALLINCHMRWEKSEDDQANKDWAANLFKDLEGHVSNTAYLNFVSEGDESTKSIYGTNTNKLLEIKAKYDPDNFFTNTYSSQGLS